MVVFLVGEVTAVVELTTETGVRSKVIAVAETAAAGARFPAASVTERAANVGMTVPSEQKDAVTAAERRSAERVEVNTHPVAVPVLLKSVTVSSEIGSLKATV